MQRNDNKDNHYDQKKKNYQKKKQNQSKKNELDLKKTVIEALETSFQSKMKSLENHNNFLKLVIPENFTSKITGNGITHDINGGIIVKRLRAYFSKIDGIIFPDDKQDSFDTILTFMGIFQIWHDKKVAKLCDEKSEEIGAVVSKIIA